MARNYTSLENSTKHYTKEEIQKRQELEQLLVIESEELYEPNDYLNEVQKNNYKTLILIFTKAGIPVGLQDKPAIELLAINMELIEQCTKVINEQGLINKYGKPNELIQVRMKAEKAMNESFKSFGMNPQSRNTLAKNVEQSAKRQQELNLLEDYDFGVM